MTTKLDALARFGALVLDESRDSLGDLDGGWLQETAVKCGLLEPVEVTAENICRKPSQMGGEDEYCYCECEIGDTCYRRTEAAHALDVSVVEPTSPRPIHEHTYKDGYCTACGAEFLL